MRKYYDAHKDAILAKGNVYNKKRRDRIKAVIQDSIDSDQPMPTVARTFITKIVLYQAKWRAKQAGLPFNLTIDDIVVPDICPISQERLQINTGRGPAPNSPTLDRLIPELGYVVGNVAVISAGANSSKGNKDVKYFERMVDYMKGSDDPRRPAPSLMEDLFNAS